MRGQGVAAHDVHLDQLRPPPVALDADLAGVAGRGDLRGVRLEVGRADPGAAPDQRAFPDLGRTRNRLTVGSRKMAAVA